MSIKTSGFLNTKLHPKLGSYHAKFLSFHSKIIILGDTENDLHQDAIASLATFPVYLEKICISVLESEWWWCKVSQNITPIWYSKSNFGGEIMDLLS